MSWNHRYITAEQFWQALVDAEILTLEQHVGIRRIVIDAEEGKPVMMYLEQFADERLLNVAISLNGIEVQHAGSNPGVSKASEQQPEKQDQEGTPSAPARDPIREFTDRMLDGTER